MAKAIKDPTKGLRDRLNGMVGGQFFYAGNIHTVSECTIDEENQKFTIKTNLNQFSRLFESSDKFLEYWEPVKDQSGIAKVNSEGDPGPAITTDNSLADKMIGILEDNIKKVQVDPKYIEQAKSINNNVNSVINIVKLKMAFEKEARKK